MEQNKDQSGEIPLCEQGNFYSLAKVRGFTDFGMTLSGKFYDEALQRFNEQYDASLAGEVVQGSAAVRGEAVAESALRFRKKPVEISAIQWTGANLHQVTTFMEGVPPDVRGMYAGERWEDYAEHVRDNGLSIPTLEGPMHASVNDWIICGVKGEHYACKPDVFEMTYESARAADAPSEPSDAVHNARLTLIRELGDEELIASVKCGKVSIHAALLKVLRAADALDSQPTDPTGYVRISELKKLESNRVAGVGMMVQKEGGDGWTPIYASSQPTDGGVRNGNG